MTAPRDPDRLIHAFLFEGDEQLRTRSTSWFVTEIEHTRQRAVIGSWRTPP